MRYLKHYKIFESSIELENIRRDANEILLEISDLGYYAKCYLESGNTAYEASEDSKLKFSIYINRVDPGNPNYIDDISPISWEDIEDCVLRLFDFLEKKITLLSELILNHIMMENIKIYLMRKMIHRLYQL